MKTLLAITAALSSFATAQGTLFVGTWPHTIQVVDEAKQKVVDHIELQTGTSHSMQVSDDRKTIYASTIEKNGIEVIDVATRKVTNSFILDEGGKKMRFTSWAPDPTGKFIYMIVRPMEKKIDRFEQGKTQFAIVDLAQKKITRFVDMPDGEDAAGGGGRGGSMRFSPDGKYLYRMGATITIYDTADFKVVDTIELSKPQFPGMQNVNLGQQLDSIQEPGILVSLFNSSDPVIHKQMFGIARFDQCVGKAQQAIAGRKLYVELLVLSRVEKTQRDIAGPGWRACFLSRSLANELDLRVRQNCAGSQALRRVR